MAVNNITDRYTVRHHTGLKLDEFDFIYPTEPLQQLSSNDINLYKLECFVRDNAEKLQKSVHLRLSNGKESAYMLSDDALMYASVEDIADMVAPELVRHLRRG